MINYFIFLAVNIKEKTGLDKTKQKTKYFICS